jgi:hypothetical protein
MGILIYEFGSPVFYVLHNHLLVLLQFCAARSKAWVCGRSLAWIALSKPAEDKDIVSCQYCVSSGRGLCDGPITRPEESY